MAILLNIAGAIIALSIIIVSHEFGHFLAAKRSGIGVPEFSMGFGPRLFGWERGETKYSLRLIPFGGYIKMAGEQPVTTTGSDREFLSKPPIIRTIVIFLGPFFNFILAVVFFSFINLFFGIGTIGNTVINDAPKVTGLEKYDRILSINNVPVSDWWEIEKAVKRNYDNTITLLRDSDTLTYTAADTYLDSVVPLVPSILGDIERNGPAYRFGLKKEDRVIQISDVEISDWQTMVNIIRESPGDTLAVVFVRSSDTLTTTVVPEGREAIIGDEVKKIGMIGVAVHMKRKNLGLYSFYQGLKDTGATIWLTVSFLKQLFTGKMSPKQLGGPLAIIQFAGQTLSWGIPSFLSFIAFLSCQLGILNLLPFPPLDGGNLLLILIEKITRKRPSEKISLIIQMVGFALLLLFMLYVTMNDITRFFRR